MTLSGIFSSSFTTQISHRVSDQCQYSMSSVSVVFVRIYNVMFLQTKQHCQRHGKSFHWYRFLNVDGRKYLTSQRFTHDSVPPLLSGCPLYQLVYVMGSFMYPSEVFTRQTKILFFDGFRRPAVQIKGPYLEAFSFKHHFHESSATNRINWINALCGTTCTWCYRKIAHSLMHRNCTTVSRRSRDFHRKVQKKIILQYNSG